MVVVADRELRIEHVSAHCGVMLGVGREKLVGEPLSAVLTEADVEALRGALAGGIEAIGWRRVALGNGATMKLHAFDAGRGLVGIDLLPLPVDAASVDAQAIERVAAWSARLLACGASDELLDVTASIVRERTAFNGAWVSRREQDGHSLLVAADVVNGPSSIGQSVSPRDSIPSQPQVGGRAIPFFVADLAADATWLSPPEPEGVDLAASLLLRPYPEFLARMLSLGVRSMASLPLLVRGELWGRVIAFHPSALRVPAATQTELALLAVAASARLEELLALERTREHEQLSRGASRVVQSIAATDALLEGLTRDEHALPAACAADAAIASVAGRTVSIGGLDAAAAEQLLEVARAALRARTGEPLAWSTTLGGTEPRDPARAAGYLAVRFDAAADDLIVWTRGELDHTRTWASPQVVGQAERDELFVGQTERVEHQRGSCMAWTPAQQQQAGHLRDAIAEVIVARYAQVESLNAELTRSNEEYDAFAHAAAHDLKAPLRGIRQNTEFFLEDNGDGLAADEAAPLQTVIRLADRMTGMLEDLMAYAQVGQAAWNPEPLDLGQAVADARELLGPRLAGATLTAAPGTLTVDASGLRQILINLIGNAAKYSAGPATIAVDVITLEQASRHAPVPASLAGSPPGTEVLTVADRGIGIEAGHHDRIFELFRQLDPQTDGTGTGLALCRLICRRHGGDIWLTSTPGEGTTFYVVAGRCPGAGG